MNVAVEPPRLCRWDFLMRISLARIVALVLSIQIPLAVPVLSQDNLSRKRTVTSTTDPTTQKETAPSGDWKAENQTTVTDDRKRIVTEAPAPTTEPTIRVALATDVH